MGPDGEPRRNSRSMAANHPCLFAIKSGRVRRRRSWGNRRAGAGRQAAIGGILVAVATAEFRRRGSTRLCEWRSKSGMSFFANQSVAGSHPSIHHFRVNSSQYGSIIPIVYGRARIPGIFIWTGDFSATKSHGPGKGLGGTGGSFYTYSVSVEIALSQGPIASLGRSWHMGNGGLKRHTAAQTNSNWTLFSGAFGQMPWSYMTSKHPGQDLGYSGVAYLARSAWNLGTTGSPPQITFEVFGLAPYGSGVSDANPRDVIGDILINPRYGLGLAPSCLADSADFSNYCVANSFFISPVFD